MTEQIPLLEHDPRLRRPMDYYRTPEWATRALLKRVAFGPLVLEPCVGDGAIAAVFGRKVLTNDFDASRPADYHEDVTTDAGWERLPPADVVTNPPFNMADEIVPRAVYRLPPGGLVAMLLRLSWLEPTEARGEFLAEHPPCALIVLPRHDYKGRGSTDSVTSAWMVWRRVIGFQVIEIVTKAERDELIARGRQ